MSIEIIPVQVNLDEQTHQLTVQNAQIELQANQGIQWNFQNTHPGHVPHIFFPDRESHNDQQFGPFQYIERIFSSLLAFGNTGSAGSYTYILTLFDVDGPVTTPAQAIIINQMNTPDTSPDATVQYSPPASQESLPSFLVTPSSLSLQVGQTATWHIKGIPAGHFVSFRFDDERPTTGPFSSFSLSRGVGDCWRANATNFLFDRTLLSPLPAQISYHVTLRDAQGTPVLHAHDPVIEPLGPPIAMVEE